MSGNSNEMPPDPPDRDDLDAVRTAAEHGDAEAQYNLGGLYYTGDGTEKDLV